MNFLSYSLKDWGGQRYNEFNHAHRERQLNYAMEGARL